MKRPAYIHRFYFFAFLFFVAVDLVVSFSSYRDPVKVFCKKLPCREHLISRATQDLHISRISSFFFADREEELLQYVSHFDGILWADEQGWLVHYMYLALQRLFFQRDRLEQFLVTSFQKGSKILQGDLFHQNAFAKLQLETGAAYSLRSRAMEYFLLQQCRKSGPVEEKIAFIKSMMDKYPDSPFFYTYIRSPEFLQIYNSCKDLSTQHGWEQYFKKLEDNQHPQNSFGPYFFLKGNMVALRNRKSKVQYNTVSLIEGWEEVQVVGCDGDWVSIRCLGERGFLHRSHLSEDIDVQSVDRQRFRIALQLYENHEYLQAASELAYLIRTCKNTFLKERTIAFLHKVHIEIRKRAESRNSPYTKYVLMHPKYFCITEENQLGDSFLLFNFLKRINPKSPFFRLFQYQT